MDYQTLIKLCKKYNIDYKNHYGKSKSYIKINVKYSNIKMFKTKNKKKIIHLKNILIVNILS